MSMSQYRMSYPYHVCHALGFGRWQIQHPCLLEEWLHHRRQCATDAYAWADVRDLTRYILGLKLEVRVCVRCCTSVLISTTAEVLVSLLLTLMGAVLGWTSGTHAEGNT